MYEVAKAPHAPVVTRSREESVYQLVGARTYKSAVYETLYELIQHLELPPGERLVEADLSTRFRVSKTPIREALVMLAKDGLVEVVPHVGATVSWLTLEDYEQNLFILDAIELPALRLVADRATAEDLADWEQRVRKIERAFRRGRSRDYRTLILQLHQELFTAAGYPRLVEIITEIQRALYRYGVVFVDSSPQDRAGELEVVTQRVELLRKHDPDGAAELIRTRHAEMFESARERVARPDPAVRQYLHPTDR
jgi:DNA-binding GntR family transcriptional regulator